MYKKYSPTFKKTLLNLTALSLTMSSFSSLALTVDEKRVRYLDAKSAISREDLRAFDYLIKNIKDYPLYPYLDHQKFIKKLDTYNVPEMEAFSSRNKGLPFMPQVRAKYIAILAERNQWSDLLTFQPYPPNNENGKCNYYYAHSQVGDKKLAMKGAKSLYLSGRSIDQACDKLFSILKEKGQLTDDLILERMMLAFKNKDKALINYLVSQVSGKSSRKANQILSLYNNPQGVSAFSKKNKVDDFNQTLTYVAFERLVRISPAQAIDHFSSTVKGQHLSIDKQQELADKIIHRLMASTNKKLVDWRDKWIATTKNPNLIERRFRLALVENDWNAMEYWLSRFSKEEKANTRWQYWSARIAERKGDTAKADEIYQAILGQRHFYSVAAAIKLQKPISVPFKTESLDKNALATFQPALDRVSEFLALDEITRAKREWQFMLLSASEQQKSMLAAYALKKNWYHLSVQATISGSLWEHLELRFPVAYRWWFEFFSRERKLPITTLLALSRQESAFYSHAQSPVGARGLMQLMPRTAKETSKKLGVRFLGNESLKDPAINISLGSGYLRMLLDDYEENRILAFAAYNAGPHRVKSWLKRSDGNLDAIAFIEAIPFHETRGYVQNVLMYELYYQKILGMPIEFLDEQETARVY